MIIYENNNINFYTKKRRRWRRRFKGVPPFWTKKKGFWFKTFEAMIVENSLHHRPRRFSSDQKGVWKTAARISTTDLFPHSLPKLISHPTSSLTSFERPVIHREYLLPSFLENKARRRSQKSLSSFLRLENILIFTLLIKLKLKVCARICIWKITPVTSVR